MINKRITEARKKIKISEKELAAKIEMSLTGFRQAMSKDDFKASTLILLSKALEVPVGYFFGETIANVTNGDNNNHTQTANGFNISQSIGDKDCPIELKMALEKIKFLEEQLKLNSKIISLLEQQKQ